MVILNGSDVIVYVYGILFRLNSCLIKIKVIIISMGEIFKLFMVGMILWVGVRIGLVI